MCRLKLIKKNDQLIEESDKSASSKELNDLFKSNESFKVKRTVLYDAFADWFSNNIKIDSEIKDIISAQYSDTYIDSFSFAALYLNAFGYNYAKISEYNSGSRSFDEHISRSINLFINDPKGTNWRIKVIAFLFAVNGSWKYFIDKGDINAHHMDVIVCALKSFINEVFKDDGLKFHFEHTMQFLINIEPLQFTFNKIFKKAIIANGFTHATEDDFIIDNKKRSIINPHSNLILKPYRVLSSFLDTYEGYEYYGNISYPNVGAKHNAHTMINQTTMSIMSIYDLSISDKRRDELHDAVRKLIWGLFSMGVSDFPINHMHPIVDAIIYDAF